MYVTASVVSGCTTHTTAAAKARSDAALPKRGARSGRLSVRRTRPNNSNAHATCMAMFVARYAAASVSFAAKLSAKDRPATGRPASGVFRGCAHAPVTDRIAGFATIAISSSKIKGADKLLI